MNKINFPLNRRARGPQVADLQNVLRVLLERALILANEEGVRRELAAALGPELERQAFGEVTAKVVSIFQQEQRLEPSGDVDGPTADVFNKLLRELGLLDPERPPAFRLVAGVVRREDGLPLQGVQVRAAHVSEQREIRLGEDNADAEGRYTIRYEALPGEDTVHLKVSAIGEEGRTLAASAILPNAKSIEILDLRVPIATPAADRQTIEGAILLEHGQPADKLKLRLYRRDFGGKATLLDETTTVGDGRYAFSFDAGSRAASLEVRAVQPDGTEFPKPLSKPLNDLTAESRARLNLLAPKALQPLAAEYRRLAADLAPLLPDAAAGLKSLKEVKEDDQLQDLSALNRATGWDARLIALASVSERLAADADVGLPSDELYGLLRAGLPSDKLLLAQVEPDVAEMALKKVRDVGILELDDVGIEAFKTKFTTFANKTRLKMPVPGSRSTYGDLLESSGLSADAQDKFAPVFLKHRGDGAQLWEEASKTLAPEDVRKLQLQGKLAFLAGNSEAMTTRMLAKNLKDPSDLAADFHSAVAWKTELFDQAGIPRERRVNPTDADRKKLEALIPGTYGGEKVEARLEAYAEDMARKVRLSYPTQVLGRLLETDQRFKLSSGHDTTVQLLKNASAQGFRLGETPVSSFLKSRPGVREGLSEAELREAGENMKVLQRVYQITPSTEAMPVLLSLGMSSAFDVMAYPEEEFVSLFKARYLEIHKKPAPKGVPELVSRKAKQVSSVTYNLFAIAKKLDSEPFVAGISAAPLVRENVKKELIQHFPTMESLFGSMDYCECEHCRSVLSPAAYLVDLLQFVDTEPAVWGNFLAQWKATHKGQEYPHKNAAGEGMKPYDVLVERRPDLPHIALTCENTNTALPYIDIVNEILEYYVANGKLAAEAARDTGDATTAELLAEPQNVIREAYDTLRKARYPLNLPFDLWLETVRKFCDFFETPLHRVLEVFQPDAPIFMESLGLAPAEVDIFADPNPLLTWHELYGFATAAEATTEATDARTGQRRDLHSAKALSRRLGVTYKEIAEIVQTGFVNSELGKLSLLYKLNVSVRDAKLYQDEKAFYQANRDLLGAERSTLSAADQQRFDDLAKKRPNREFTGWQVLGEVAAFEQKLADLASVFDPPLNVVDLQNAIQAVPFHQVLVLADPDTSCNFDLTTLQYADRTQADAIVFLRINLFVRLWRMLGWSIEETDRALTTFVPKSTPFDVTASNLARQPLRTALIYLAHLKALDAKLKVGKQSRLKLLTLWSDIPTTGKKSLYTQLFLTPSVLKNSQEFDHPLGQYLSDTNVELKDHLLAVQGALGLTTDEIGRILADAGALLDTAKLSLANVSILYRYGLLAKALRLSVRDLIALKQLSGLDPFRPLPLDPRATLDPDHPLVQTLELVQVVEEVKASGLKLEDLEYLLRHRFDETGKYRPDRETTFTLLKTLSEGIRAIRAEHAIPEEPILERQRIGQLIVRTMIAHTGADPVLVESFVEDERLLAARGPLLDTFAAAAEQGLDATFWTSAEAAEVIEAVERAATLLNKALQVVQSLGLVEREIRYLLTHAADFEGVSLSELPTAKVGDSPAERVATAQRFGRFRRLAAYARLKRELAGGTDDLIGIFEAGGTAAADRLEKQVYPLIARLTRRDAATVQATAEALVPAPAVPAFESEKPLWRLWEALQVVERFGVPPGWLLGWSDLIQSATPSERRFKIARGAKAAIQARLEPAAWQRVAQPIFDKLRPRQRDALASYVMHQRGFDRLEELYEYFLVDPGMESVVQTSRIRLAIGSLQLFIQRSLLNLEKKVHPVTINAKQWEWMKRYRVWEANRKIFLFPENWLEPEFRDDKTHLFTELEGALLQGDVSRDLVDDALFNYLKKLDELARLDICAMHIEDDVEPALRVLHVFGRTYSQPHKYFYRSYAHQMWTPWEPVSAEIEGDHLAPVIWRDRLYLFWVTFTDQADPNPASGGATGSKKLTDTTLTEVVADLKAVVANKRVDLQLHWSEYLNGEWTTRESGGFSEVITRILPATFRRNSVFVHVTKELDDGHDLGVFVHLSSPINSAFFVAGRNSVPEVAAYTNKPANPFNSANTASANRYRGKDSFKVSFKERITTEPGKTPPPANPDILKKGITPGGNYTLLPCNNHLTALGVSEDAFGTAANPNAVQAALKSGLGEIATLMKPVFYQDSRHTFFVEPDVRERTIEEWQEWVTRTPVAEPPEWRDPERWKGIVVIPEIPRRWPIEPDDDPRRSIHPGSLINPGRERDWLINAASAIKFGDVLIGPAGQPGIEIRPDVDLATSLGRVNAGPGGDLANGSSIVLSDAEAFARSGLRELAGGLNVVGGAGFNAALEINFTDLNQSRFGAAGSGRTER